VEEQPLGVQAAASDHQREAEEGEEDRRDWKKEGKRSMSENYQSDMKNRTLEEGAVVGGTFGFRRRAVAGEGAGEPQGAEEAAALDAHLREAKARQGWEWTLTSAEDAGAAAWATGCSVARGCVTLREEERLVLMVGQLEAPCRCPSPSRERRSSRG
jgi:hypothetical protein